MQLYVANASRQIHDFTIRKPEQKQTQTQSIPIGGQILVSGIDNQAAIDSVLDQHRLYGLISIDELDRVRGPFSGLCYSINKPVSFERLHRAMTRRMESLEEQGKRQRQEAAVATNNQIENTLQESADLGGDLKNFEMSIIEEDRPGKPRGDWKPVAEGIRVNRAGDDRPSPKSAIKRGRKAA